MYDRVTGPYTHMNGDLKGRNYMCLFRDGKKTQMLYSRYLMELHLGRRLSYDEVVDHIDRDFTNDSLDNLRVVSRSQNSKDDAARVVPSEFKCPLCGIVFIVNKLNSIRGNAKKGRAGPFCGRSCAGKYSMAVYTGRLNPIPPKPLSELQSEYYYLEKEA